MRGCCIEQGKVPAVPIWVIWALMRFRRLITVCVVEPARPHG